MNKYSFSYEGQLDRVGEEQIYFFYERSIDGKVTVYKVPKSKLTGRFYRVRWADNTIAKIDEESKQC